MKIYKALAVIFASIIGFAPNVLTAQDTPSDTTWNQTDMNGYKQGYWKKYYDDGVLRYKGFFQDNRPVGQLTRYYDSGKKMADIEYSPDGLTSYASLYYQSGTLAAEGKYIHQDKDSLWKYYSYYTKSLSFEETFVSGKKQGISNVYYDNEQIAQSTMWHNDMRHGPWKQYFEDSSIRLISRYENNKLEGSYQSFNMDGILVIEGVHHQDKQVGTWKYYLDDGSEDFELIYIDGVLQNEEVMHRKLEEFMKEFEKNSGTIPEPDLDNFIPQ